MRLKVGSRYPVREFGLFGVVGALATGLQYLIMAVLVQAFSVHPATASATGFGISAFLNYALNYHLTFRSTKPHVACAPRFAVVSTSGLLLTFLLMRLFFDLFGLHYLVAQILTTLTVLVWNFLSTVVPFYFLGGVRLLCIGIIGEYLGKIYLEVKGRPRYHIDKIV